MGPDIAIGFLRNSGTNTPREAIGEATNEIHFFSLHEMK